MINDPSDIHSAVRATLSAGSGRARSFIRHEDGSIAGYTELSFDVIERRAQMRNRFLVEDDTADENAEPSEWIFSVAVDDLLLLEVSGVTEWSSVELPWPANSPLCSLYWLLGTTDIISERSSVGDPAGTLASVKVSVSEIIAAADAADRPGILQSIEHADLDEDGSFAADVLISGDRSVRRLSFELPSLEPTTEPGLMLMETEIDELGLQVDIKIPPHDAPVAPQEFIDGLLEDDIPE